MSPVDRSLACSLGNLSHGASAIAAGQEKRLGYLSELADALIESLVKTGEVTSARSLTVLVSQALAELPMGCECARTEPARNRRLWDVALAELAEGDRALFAGVFAKKCEACFGRAMSLSDFPDGTAAPPERSRTVYVRNPLSDSAYRLLSERVTAPTVAYRQGFRELCDDVENGYADYAVLPLFSGGARIGTVFSLLEDYGLHVAAVASLDGGEEEVTFALVSREALALLEPNRFLFSLTLPEDALPGLTLAMRRIGVLPKRFEAVPLSDEAGQLTLRAAVGGDVRSLTVFLIYLSLFWPGCVGYGFYTEPE